MSNRNAGPQDGGGWNWAAIATFGGSVLGAITLVCCVAWEIASRNEYARGTMPTRGNEVAIVDVNPIKQVVNAYGFTSSHGVSIDEAEAAARFGGIDAPSHELMTFEATIFNSSEKLLRINSIEFIPSQVRDLLEGIPREAVIRTAVCFMEIDHRGHIRIPFDKIEVDKGIRTHVDLIIPANASRTVTIWFKPTDTLADSPIDADGLLLFTSSDGGIAVRKITLKSRPDGLRPFNPAVANRRGA